MLVWRVVKGLPWRRPGNSQPSCGGCGRIQQAAGSDEERTLARLRALRSYLIDPTIAVHNGRIVKRTGDGVVARLAHAALSLARRQAAASARPVSTPAR